MLRSTGKNISVITNFGCRSECWYCIWKGHELENVNHETDWSKLQRFLWDNRGLGKVSVSGGGDSLYQFDAHKSWWAEFFHVCFKFNLKIDVHTREKFRNPSFWFGINRCVFSSDKLKDDLFFLCHVAEFTKLRITHLVTKETTDRVVEDYLSFQDRYNCQFTIKQLVGHDDGGRYSEIRKKFPGIYHLDVGDYNLYYMPDNSIRERFLPEGADNGNRNPDTSSE